MYMHLFFSNEAKNLSDMVMLEGVAMNLNCLKITYTIVGPIVVHYMLALFEHYLMYKISYVTCEMNFYIYHILASQRGYPNLKSGTSFLHPLKFYAPKRKTKATIQFSVKNFIYLACVHEHTMQFKRFIVQGRI